MEKRQFRYVKTLLMAWVVAMLSASGYANTVLYSTGFEASEGYTNVSSINYSDLAGTPTTSPQWSGSGKLCKSGFQVPYSDDGGPDAFAGTQTAFERNGYGTLTFNTDPTVGNGEVFVEGYMMFIDHPAVTNVYEGIKFGLLDSDGKVQICVKMSDWKGTGGGMFTTWNSGISPTSTANQGTSWTGVNKQWFHVGIVVNYQTQTADFYARMVSVGDTTPLTADDRIFENKPIYIGNQNFASTLFIQSDWACDAHFDNITVTDGPQDITMMSTYVYDSSKANWYGEGDFTPAGNNPAKMSTKDVYYGTNYENQIYVCGTADGYNVLLEEELNSWAGAEWTAPENEIVTEVVIQGHFRSDTHNEGFGVLGGNEYPDETAYMTFDWWWYTGTTPDMHDYGPYYVDMSESDQVRTIQLRPLWFIRTTDDYDYGVVFGYPNNLFDGGCYYGNMWAVTIRTKSCLTDMPVFTPSEKIISGPTMITITSSTPGATIYYTTNGSKPTTSSNLYSGPVEVDGGVTLRAIAVASDTSWVTSQTFEYPFAEAPTFTPDDMYVSGPITIATTSSGAEIRYTTNGDTPTSASTLYTGPITISEETTLKAIALGNGYQPSAVTVQHFMLPTIPIMAWSGIPQGADSNIMRFEELRECGFTHQLMNYSTVDNLQSALDCGKKTGIKTLPTVGYTTVPTEWITLFKDHPALGGYSVADEPQQADFAAIAAQIQAIQALDPAHSCYVNLYPNGEGDPISAYQDYLDNFIATVPVDKISFDIYPIKTTGVRSDFYQNLEVIRDTANAAGKPFWAFALATAHWDYPVPTLTHLRYQMYSNLAYGAQGLEYFIYWNLGVTSPDFHDAPIEVDGSKTSAWYAIQEMNQEIQGLSNVFLGAEVSSVGHTGLSIPTGTTMYSPEAPILSLSTVGDGAVVSRLSNGDNEYLVVVNRSITSQMTLNLTVDVGQNISRVFKTGVTTSLTSGTVQYTVDPADIVILQWVDALLPGDANGDGMVDVGDLGILAANYGTASGATWQQGDFNGDGAVDVGDLGILAANYGTGASSANWDADYAKVFGETASEDDAELTSTLCGTLGLPLVAGLALLGLMLVKLED